MNSCVLCASRYHPCVADEATFGHHWFDDCKEKNPMEDILASDPETGLLPISEPRPGVFAFFELTGIYVKKRFFITI